MKKHIVLCADDYGQAEAVSKAIISLLDANRLSAVSCLVNKAGWEEEGKWLKPFAYKADIGLHLNLTQGRPLSAIYRRHYGDTFKSLPWLLIQSLSSRLDITVIKTEIEAQLNAFIAIFGHLPSHLDGHQHIHQFPVVHQAVLAVYRERLNLCRPYIRVSCPSYQPDWTAGIKQYVIRTLGLRFKPFLDKHHIPYNQDFAGIYSFKINQFRQCFSGFLQKIQSGGLIMCHPGWHDADDEITNTRQAEYAYFASEAFLEDCNNYQVVIKRFSR